MKDNKLIECLSSTLEKFDKDVADAVRAYVNINKKIVEGDNNQKLYSIVFGSHDYQIPVDDGVDDMVRRVASDAMRVVVSMVHERQLNLSEPESEEEKEESEEEKEIREAIMSKLPKPVLH